MNGAKIEKNVYLKRSRCKNKMKRAVGFGRNEEEDDDDNENTA